MLVALFIILFVTQPGIANAKNQTDCNEYQNAATNNSQCVPVVNKYEKHYAPGNETQEVNSDNESSSNIWIIFFTAVLAIASIYQAYRSHRDSQWELRAYLGFDGEEPKPGELVRFKIENFGQTPALSVSVWTTWDIATPEDVDFGTAIPTEKKDRTYFVIEPRTAVHSSIEPTEEGWGRIRKAIPDGVSALWYVGQIDYVDVFGKTHWRKFRLRTYRGTTETMPDERIRMAFEFHVCKEGNETDDTNKKKKAWLEWLKAPFLLS